MFFVPKFGGFSRYDLDLPASMRDVTHARMLALKGETKFTSIHAVTSSIEYSYIIRRALTEQPKTKMFTTLIIPEEKKKHT